MSAKTDEALRIIRVVEDWYIKQDKDFPIVLMNRLKNILSDIAYEVPHQGEIVKKIMQSQRQAPINKRRMPEDEEESSDKRRTPVSRFGENPVQNASHGTIGILTW